MCINNCNKKLYIVCFIYLGFGEGEVSITLWMCILLSTTVHNNIFLLYA
jgi:hypothetical protein